MRLINIFRTHIFKRGIIAIINFQEENFKQEKIYVKYGKSIKIQAKKLGFDAEFKKTAHSEAIFDNFITRSEFPKSKYEFLVEFVRKKITIEIQYQNESTKKISGYFEEDIVFPEIQNKPGVKFVGYFIDQTYTQQFLEIKYPHENIKIFSKEELIEYPVRYFGFNNGKNNFKNPNKITINQTITLLSPELPGHKFLGWYEHSRFKGSEIKQLSKIDYDLYLYAKFEINSYFIEFITNSQDKFDNKFFLFNTKIEIDERPKDIPGFKFKDWFFKDKPFELKTMPDHNLKLIAKWDPILYNIELVLNYENKTKNITYSRLIEVLDLETPSRSGFTFIGWYKDQSLEGSKIYKVRTEIMSNITLYSKWEIKKHTVKLYDGNELIRQLNIQDGKKLNLAEMKLEKPDWIFNGWSETETKFTEFDLNRTINKDLVLYAIWGKYKKITKDEYSIKKYSDSIEIKFMLLNSCEIMQREYVTLFINVLAKPRNIKEEDFYFDNSIENSNVWSTDRRLITHKSMNARYSKQISSGEIKNFSISIDKKKLVYYFSGKHTNSMNILILDNRDILFKEEISFENQSNLILNDTLNTMKSAVEISLKYILLTKLNLIGNMNISPKQKAILSDFQNNKLESNEIFSLDSIINEVYSNRNRYSNLMIEMNKSLSFTSIIDDVREIFIKFLLQEEEFSEKILDEVENFSNNLVFDFSETIEKITSNLKDSNTKLSLSLFGIKDNLQREIKLEKINKIYLNFSKKIISSNKAISEKAKEVIKYLTKERKKLEE